MFPRTAGEEGRLRHLPMFEANICRIAPVHCTGLAATASSRNPTATWGGPFRSANGWDSTLITKTPAVFLTGGFKWEHVDGKS